MNTIVILVSMYIASQIFSDIASLRIVMLAGFSIDAGTLIYPLTFTLRDLLHKAGGRKLAVNVVVCAGIANAVMALYFWVVSAMQADLNVGEQIEFGRVLAPVWNIVIASILAEIVSELVDTQAYHLFVQRFGERYQWARVLVSNALAIPIDSALFCVVAFWGMGTDAILAIFISNVIVKVACTILSIPAIYAVKGK